MKTASEKTATATFTFKTEGRVGVTCNDCGHSFNLWNTRIGENKVVCPFCNAEGTVDEKTLAFHRVCEGES